MIICDLSVAAWRACSFALRTGLQPSLQTVPVLLHRVESTPTNQLPRIQAPAAPYMRQLSPGILPSLSSARQPPASVCDCEAAAVVRGDSGDAATVRVLARDGASDSELMDYSAALHSPGSGRNGWSCGSPAVETPSPSGETVRASRPRSACRDGPATAGPGLPKACQARICVHWGGQEPTTSSYLELDTCSPLLTAGWPAPEAGPKLARHAGLLPRRRGARPQGRAVALPLTRTPA